MKRTSNRLLPAVGLALVATAWSTSAPAAPAPGSAGVRPATAAAGTSPRTIRAVPGSTPAGSIGPRGGTLRPLSVVPAPAKPPPAGLRDPRFGRGTSTAAAPGTALPVRTPRPAPGSARPPMFGGPSGPAPGVLHTLSGGGAAKSLGVGGFRPVSVKADPLALLAYPDGPANEVAARAMIPTIGALPGMRIMKASREMAALRLCAPADAAPEPTGAPGSVDDESDPRALLVSCLLKAAPDNVDKILWLDTEPGPGGRTQTVRAMLLDRRSGGIERWAEATASVETEDPTPETPELVAAIEEASRDASEQLGGAFSAMDLLDSMPLLLLLLVALIVLLSDSFVRRPGPRAFALYISLAGLAGTLALIWVQWDYTGAPAPRSLFGGFASGGAMMVLDRYSLFFNLIYVLAAGLGVLLTYGYHRIHGGDRGERYALILLAATGMMVMSAATDLVVIFIGLETMSLAVYVMVGSNRARSESAEAAIKYFIMGAVASGVLIYGIALVYAATATTRLDAIATAVRAGGLQDAPLMLVGMFLILGAFAFKIAAAPMHAWVPDAYQGAPSPVTGFMSVAVKAAAFAAFARVLMLAFGDLHGLPAVGMSAVEAAASTPPGWFAALQTLTWLTLIVGNTAAIPQTNIKRMLAYSGIAHAGYLLIGLCTLVSVARSTATAAMLFYLLAYTVTNLGAFGVLIALGKRGDERLTLESWAGIARRHPALALAMVVCLASLAGIPPTGGFFAKFYLFKAAVDAGLTDLAVLGVITSLAGMYYYLRIVVYMYMREAPAGSEQPAEQPLRSPALVLAITIAVLAILALGLLPGAFLELASAGAPALGGM